MVLRAWSLRQPFVISRQSITEVETLEVVVADLDGIQTGRGAAAGLDYAGETWTTMVAQIEAARTEIERNFDREALINILPQGGARAAVDAALWDLEAKRSRRSPFEIAQVTPAPVQSMITLSIKTPYSMEQAAEAAASAPWIKIKVGHEDPLASVKAARRGAPKARMLVDPNQAWTLDQLNAFAPALADLGVELLEQPTALDLDHFLDDYRGPLPLCADESCDGISDLPRLAGRYSAINIKLDKIGGLTAALALADAAQSAGFGLMVGSMLASSLTVAPAMVLAQRCRWVDLDAPPFLTTDDDPPFRFDSGLVEHPYLPSLWG